MVSMRGPLLIALSLSLSPPTALAETPQFDGVVAPSLLSDADLYRLATCGAPPGGDCLGPTLRWDRPVLTVTVIPGDDPLPDGFAMPLIQATVQAVDQINAAGAGLRIELLPIGPADITIRPTALTEGTVLVDTPGFSGQGIMGVGFMTVWSGEDDIITDAVILISTTITRADLTSVVLEEVTQSLGFLYDVEGPAYEGVSILSQTSNTTTVIAGQDAALLRLHYPPS
jgi:Protein of unknown function (DUF2927)